MPLLDWLILKCLALELLFNILFNICGDGKVHHHIIWLPKIEQKCLWAVSAFPESWSTTLPFSADQLDFSYFFSSQYAQDHPLLHPTSLSVTVTAFWTFPSFCYVSTATSILFLLTTDFFKNTTHSCDIWHRSPYGVAGAEASLCCRSLTWWLPLSSVYILPSVLAHCFQLCWKH